MWRKKTKKKLKNSKRENGRKKEKRNDKQQQEKRKEISRNLKNVKEYWGNHHDGVIGIWRGRKEWGRRKRNEKGGKKRGKGRNQIQEKEEQLMINLNEAKLMNEEKWIETTKFFLLFSCFCFSFLFYCLLPFRSSNLFSYFANFFISFFKLFLIFVVFVEEEFEETDEEICKIGKKIAGSEMQETIEEEWKAETREKRERERERESKEEVEGEKKKIIFSILAKMWKTRRELSGARRELYGAKPYDINYIGLLIYINDKQ